MSYKASVVPDVTEAVRSANFSAYVSDLLFTARGWQTDHVIHRDLRMIRGEETIYVMPRVSDYQRLSVVEACEHVDYGRRVASRLPLVLVTTAVVPGYVRNTLSCYLDSLLGAEELEQMAGAAGLGMLDRHRQYSAVWQRCGLT